MMLALAFVLALGAGAQAGRPGLVAKATAPNDPTFLSNSLSTTFDGTNDYVDLGVPVDLDGAWNAREMTISVWTKRVDDTFERDLITKYGTGASLHLILNILSGPAYRAFNSAVSTTGAAPPAFGVWHHTAVRLIDVAGTKTVQVAINGALAGTTVTAGSTTNVLRWLIGCRWSSAAMAAVSLCWQGQIDEVSFWSVGLSAGELTELYNSGRPSNLANHSRASTLLHWYRMGDGDTYPTITDRKGSANGTATNMAGAGNFAADVP